MGYSAFRIAGVAQLVEHLIRNEGVVGSSPITGTTYQSRPRDFFCKFEKCSRKFNRIDDFDYLIIFCFTFL